MKAKRPKKVKVVEKKLGRERAWGQCWIGEHLIEIEQSLKGRKKLSTLLHEALHECFNEMSETRVLRAEKILIQILWDQGYREVDL